MDFWVNREGYHILNDFSGPDKDNSKVNMGCVYWLLLTVVGRYYMREVSSEKNWTVLQARIKWKRDKLETWGFAVLEEPFLALHSTCKN